MQLTSIHELFEAEYLDLVALVREELHLGSCRNFRHRKSVAAWPTNLILFSLKHHQITSNHIKSMKFRGHKFEPLQDNDRCNFSSAWSQISVGPATLLALFRLLSGYVLAQCLYKATTVHIWTSR